MQPQTKPPAKPVCADSFLNVVGTGGCIATAALQPQHHFQRGKNDAICADEEDTKRLHEPPSMAKFPKKATRERANPANLSPRPSEQLQLDDVEYPHDSAGLASGFRDLFRNLLMGCLK